MFTNIFEPIAGSNYLVHVIFSLVVWVIVTLPLIIVVLKNASNGRITTAVFCVALFLIDISAWTARSVTFGSNTVLIVILYVMGIVCWVACVVLAVIGKKKIK